MKIFKISVAALLGLFMLVGMDANAYQLVHEKQLVDNYGSAITSYQMDGNGIVADVKAAIGQDGAAHSGSYFKIIPDDKSSVVKEIIVDVWFVSTGYGNAYATLNEIVSTSVDWNIIQTYPKVLKFQATSNWQNVHYGIKLKTNTIYRIYVEATVQAGKSANTVVNAHSEVHFGLPFELKQAQNVIKTEMEIKSEAVNFCQ